jgi:hypothetical protein
VYTGTLEPNDGFVTIYNDLINGHLDPDPTAKLFDNSQLKVSLSIDQGVIAEVSSFLNINWSYDEYDAEYPGNLYPDASTGNGYSWYEACEFNSYGPDGCYYVPQDPQAPLFPAQLIKGLNVASRSLSYNILLPHSYDRCDYQFVGRCSEYWAVSNEYNFRVASRKPVTYTLRFGDPVSMGVPEPASWAMMIAGFGLVGGSLRKKRYKVKYVSPKLA